MEIMEVGIVVLVTQAKTGIIIIERIKVEIENVIARSFFKVLFIGGLLWGNKYFDYNLFETHVNEP